jgi:hypothetical protein
MCNKYVDKQCSTSWEEILLCEVVGHSLRDWCLNMKLKVHFIISIHMPRGLGNVSKQCK